MSTEQAVRIPVPDPSRQRGAEVRLRTPGEFHRCWFPIALSAEVPVGGVRGTDFLDGRVVVYRTSDGQAHVQSAYCRHLGADLSLGKVVDDRLQCPFHYWQYDGSGACAHIPAGDRPPPQARLHAYPVAESLGLIWAFNGEGPTEPVPGFDLAESALAVRTFRNPHPIPADLACVFVNSFDLQHFRVVHGMPFEVDESAVLREPHAVSYDAHVQTPEFGTVVQRRKHWGVSTLSVESERAGRRFFMMHAMCPTSPTMTQGFLVNATPAGTDAATREEVDRMLAQAEAYSLRLVSEDAPIFETMRFRRDCLTASDRFLAFGMRYVAGFPCAHPGGGLIR